MLQGFSRAAVQPSCAGRSRAPFSIARRSISRAGAVTTAGGGRYLVELEEALGGRVLRMVDAQLASVLGIFELADACELGADVCTYVEDIGGVVRSVRVAWLTGEVTEITIRSAARVA
jgi:hypothetical protein